MKPREGAWCTPSPPADGYVVLAAQPHPLRVLHQEHRVPSWLNPAGITPNGLVLPEQHKSGFTAPSAT